MFPDLPKMVVDFIKKLVATIGEKNSKIAIPNASDSSLTVVCSRPTRKITESMFPMIVSVWSVQ